MNKQLLVGLAALVIIGFLLFPNLFKKKTDNNQTGGGFSKKEITVSEDVCGAFPKEFVSATTGKTIIKTERFDTTGTHVCQYYTDENNFITLRLNALNVENQKKGLMVLGRTFTTNAKIKMEHFVVIQSNGLINEVVLVINSNLFIAVDRTSTKTASETEIVDFAAKVSERIQKGEAVAKEVSPTQVQQVPLPQGEDIVRNFINLISEGKISEAVNMLAPETISDDSHKQTWGVQFNAFKKISLKKIEPAGENMYKVTLDVEMKPESENNPIPFYGYDKGENIRWIGLKKVDNLWRITGFSTGP